MMDEKRYEFSLIRRNLLKNTTYGEFICARCGHFSSGVNLHHIKELCENGFNEKSNFIPLCGSCHNEWDSYKAMGVCFEQFLISLPSSAWATLMKYGVFKTGIRPDELIPYAYKSQFFGEAVKFHDVHGGDVFSYFDELKKQNEVFSAFPYSDHDLMLELYGDVYERVDDFEIETLMRKNVRVCSYCV